MSALRMRPLERQSAHAIPRRSFLAAMGGLWVGAGGVLRPLRAEERLTAVQKKLLMRTEKPWNAEAFPEDLTSPITRLESFFVRCHGSVPSIDPAGFRLSVSGLIEKPSELSLADLSRFPLVTSQAALTCAGNRRLEFNAIRKVGGVQWDIGAVGGAVWEGIRLCDLLRTVRLQPGAKHVWFEGRDDIVEKQETIHFGGSIPLEKALMEDAGAPLLVTKMNGQPLLPEHGFPLRMLVPGFIGARSVKWLAKIAVSDQPSPNHFVAHAYKRITEDTPMAIDAASPLYDVAINSVIATVGWSPDRQAIRAAGGAIPSGSGRQITRVELSLDGGQTWKNIALGSESRPPFSWTPWSAELPAPANPSELAVRAFDDSGRVQAETSEWNVKGYQFNGWHRVPLKS